MSKAAAQRLAPRVTVTHEPNAPVVLAPKKDPVQSAWGNGVASTMVFADPLVVTLDPPKTETKPEKVEVKTVTAEPPATTASGKEESTELEPDAITAKAPDVTGEDKDVPGLGKSPDAIEKPGEEKDAPAEIAKQSAEQESKESKDLAPDEKQAAEKAAEDGEEGEDEVKEEVKEEEKAAEEEIVEPEKPTVKEAPTAAQVGGDGASDLSAWKTQVSGATAATPQPTLGNEPAARVTVIAGAGKTAAGKHKGGGGSLAAEAKKAVRKPPETPKQLPPPPPTPVPEADKLIADGSDKKLPSQELPVLAQRPPDARVKNDQPTVPEIDTGFADDLASKIELPAAEPKAELAPGEKKPLDKEQLDKLKNAKAKPPEENRKAKPGQKMVLDDTAPPPTPGVEVGTKGQSKEKVAQVLAELLRSPGPEGAAAEIVKEARTEAFPQAVLDKLCPGMGATKEADVIAELKAQVDSIRVIAGLTAEELDAAIKTREETVKKLAEGAKVDIDAAKTDAKKETQDGADKKAEDIAGARDAVDEQTIQMTIAANGEADPTVIELRRDKGIRDLTRRTARQDVFYEKAGERRGKALDMAHGRMRSAYMNAADADNKKIYDRLFDEAKKAKKSKAEAEKEATAAARTESTPIFEWTAKQTQALGRTFGELKESAAATIKGFRDGIKRALDSAKEMLRKWAEDRISRQEGLWDWLVRKFNEWMKEAKDDSAIWEEARNEQLRDTLVGDLKMLDDLDEAERSGVDINAQLQQRGLDDAQMTIVKAYYGGVGPEGKKQRDSIGAVAAGMRMRVKATRKPGLIEWFKTEVMNLPDSQYETMGFIGDAEKPPFNVTVLASDLNEAIDQWGTDEDKIFRALSGLTPLQARAIRACYKSEYGRSLDADLKSEMGGAELERAQAQLLGNQTIADVAALHEAMSGAGTNEDTIMQVLRGKDANERAAIVAEYKKRYGSDLDADLKSELDDGWSGPHDLQRADALMKGDTAKADAIALDQAMRGAGTDEPAITRIYEQNRAEIEAEAARKGWTTAEMEEQLRKRNKDIEDQYEKRYGDPNRPKEAPSALRQAFKSELSDAELGLANALAEGDMTKIDSAKLGVEKQSFITDDEAVNTILESQSKRARKDVERDANVALQFEAEVATMRGEPWGRDTWTAKRKNMKDQVDKEAKERSLLYMSNLETAFDKDWGGGEGGLVLMIAFNMSGDEQQKAFDLRKQGGMLTPEQEIYYAVNGPGTDVDKLKEVLKGKNKTEIEALKKTWAVKYPHEGPLDKRIEEEVGGNDAKEMEWGLQGEPQTLDEQIARAHERKEYYKSAKGAWGSYDKEAARVDRQYEMLLGEKKKLDELKDLKAPKGDKESEEDYAARLDEYAYWEGRFKLKQGSLDRAIEDHEAAVNKFADTAATIAGIVAVVAVMVIVGIATGGAGAAAIGAALASAKVAALAAVAGAAATIGTKALIKGKAYSREELAVDAIVGAVDAVASAMTAGVGGGLLKGARAGIPASRLAGLAAKSKLGAGLAKMAASERTAARMFAGALSEGLEGVASSLPSALAGNVLDEKNWLKGNPLLNIAQGTIVQTGIGAVVSGGIGGLGGISKNLEPPSMAETADVLAKRGPVADRLPLWKQYQVDNPGKPYDNFLADLDAGIIAKDVDDAARHAMQRELRGELLAEIPPSQRGQFADVPIEVMSDFDFQRFTRSSSGQAVVIFKDGKPTVILREGADIKALREEGIHLAQSKDPKFLKKFKQLDEARLANWEKLPLDEQLALYRTKLDIELDAQQRLIKNLDEQLAAVDDPALRKSLLARRKAAASNFDSLAKRFDEVDNFPAADKLKIARKKMKPPQYLDQKPRLFSKKPTTKIGKAAKDPDFATALTRRARARKEMKAIVDGLLASSTKKPSARVASVTNNLGEVWGDYTQRSHIFVTKAVGEILKGKAFVQLFGTLAKGPDLFDATKAMRNLVKAVKGLVDAKQLDRLDEMLVATKRLLDRRNLGLKHIDPFVKLGPHFESPKKLFDMVEALADLTSFRKKALIDVAGIVDRVVGKKGPKAAARFAGVMQDLAAKAKARDVIDKSKNPTAWLKAQQVLDDAGIELEKSAASFGLSKGRVKGVIEELSRSGRFDWATFRQVLADTYSLKAEKYAPLKTMIADLKKSAKTAGKKWDDVDIGAVLHWGPVFQALHENLGARAQKTLVDQLKNVLGEAMPGMKVGGYKNFRHTLKNRTIDYVTAVTSPAAQLKRLQAVMAIVRDRDSASIGEYFAAFRRKIFTGKPTDIQGALKGATHVRLASRKLDGSKRMVDGAIDLPGGKKRPNGPTVGGRYLVEDKAGKSFDPDQAKIYSDRLKAGKLKTGDPTPAKGLIYFVEDPKHADTIASHLASEKLDSRIFVATFGPMGEIRFVPRPTPPKAAKGGKGGKSGKGGKGSK